MSPPALPPSAPPPLQPLIAVLHLTVVITPSSVLGSVCPGRGDGQCPCLSASIKLCESTLSTLKSSIATLLPSYSQSLMRVLRADTFDATGIFGDGATEAQKEVTYAEVQIGLESNHPVLADAALEQILIGALIASASGTGSWQTTPPFLPLRSMLTETTVNATTGAQIDAPQTLYTAFQPPSPPSENVLNVLASTLELSPTSPPPPLPRGSDDTLVWLIPVSIVAGLICVALVCINAYCVLRMVRKPSTRVADEGGGVSRSSRREGESKSKKVVVGQHGKGRGRARVRSASGAEPSEDDESGAPPSASADEDDDEASVESPSERSPAEARPRSLSPHGRRCGGQNWTTVTYEPPSRHFLSDARFQVGPGGKPTYVLPPVQVAPSTRRSSATRGGFVDSAPPERFGPVTSAAGATPVNLGPAPWIPSNSPHRAPPSLALRRLGGGPVSGSLAMSGGGRDVPIAGTYANAGANLAPAGANLYSASARARARGNVRRAEGAEGAHAVGYGLGPASCAAESVYAAAGMSCGVGECAPTPLRHMAPPVAATPRMASHTAPPEMRLAQTRPPPPTADAPPSSSRTPTKSATSRSGCSKPAASKSAAQATAPPPELVLAARARERVRSRREQRARSESP